MGGNKDPRVYGMFINGDGCSCGHGNLYWIMIRSTIREIPMMSDDDKSAIEVARFAGGILTAGFSELAGAVFTGGFHDVTHECVQIDFECKYCPGEYPVTYEIINEETGKVADYGEYTRAFPNKAVREWNKLNQPTTYAQVYKKLERMWDNYSIIGGRHCKKWSRDFFNNL